MSMKIERCLYCNEPLSEEPKLLKPEQIKKSGFISGNETEPAPNKMSITCSKCGTYTVDLDTLTKKI